MTDILPKNPYHTYEMPEHKYWQQGQDETMKALKPILARCIDIADVWFETIYDNEGFLYNLEQILQEIDNAKS